MRTLQLGFYGDSGDIGKALAACGYAHASGDNLFSLVEQMPEGGAVFALAADYPAQRLAVGADVLRLAARKRVRLLIEYPLSVDGIAFDKPATAVYERFVVTADSLGGLAKNSILMPCGTYFLPCKVSAQPLITLARVAGYDSIAFGLPEKTHPLLFEHPQYPGVYIAACCLSRVITARAMPTRAYNALWRALIKWAIGEEVSIEWKPNTGAKYSKNDALPKNAALNAALRNVRWFADNMIHRVEVSRDMFIDKPGGDASHFNEIARDNFMGGVFEGYEAGIDHGGRQRIRNIIRGDCIGETAMVMALDAAITGNAETKKFAADIADFVFSNIFFQNDPQSPMYGLNNWYKGGPIFYGDDNARVIMGVLLTRSLLGIGRWDERLLKCSLANLRTAAKTGFRHNSLRDKSFDGKNWTDYAADETLTLPSPHYQCYIWAVYLWMYGLTEYKPFLEKARTAITMCMEIYPGGWKWTNSLTAEMTRMLLPLAFLVRVDDTPLHREWLARVCHDVIGCMDECGAIMDMFGDLAMGKYPPPQSNDSYGTTEASLIQQNGDPATDLLYTANWAYIGLHEAALVLGDKKISDACDKMTEFFCRIQVTSSEHPYLDGCWMRSFDIDKWEYWGSSADIGWGAWCVESGWVNTWISSTMFLREKGETLFNLSAKKAFAAIAPEIIKEMETDNTRGGGVATSQNIGAMPGAEQ